MHLFYTPEISAKDEFYFLNEEESKHAIRVLRLQENAEIQLTDGVGGWFTCKIIQAESKKCKLQILTCQANYQKRNYRLHLALAPTKNIDRMEWLIEKATEIGLDTFTPIISARSERRELKTERLEKIAISAMKQSFSAYKPIINSTIKFDDFIDQHKNKEVLIAHCLDSKKEFLGKIIKTNQDYIILIGPEGDFSELEINKAVKNGAKEISLGSQRLRTETAGLMAVAEINILNR